MSGERSSIGKTESAMAASFEMKIERYRRGRARSSESPGDRSPTVCRLSRKAPLTRHLCLIALFGIGCGGAETPIVESPPTTDPLPPTAIDDGPDVAVERVLEALKDGEPAVVWRQLPASYREDATRLLHGFAEQVDPELWNRTFALAGRTAELAEQRKTWFLSHEALLESGVLGAEAELVREHWSEGTALLRMFADSEVANRESLAKLDVESFLEGTGRAVFARTSGLTAALDDVEFELVTVAGDRGELWIRGPSIEARKHDYLRVEGKWLPSAVVESWDDSMGRASAAVESMTVDREKWASALDDWESALDSAEAAATEEALHALIDGYLGVTPEEATPTVRTSLEGAVVVIRRPLTAEEEEQLQVALNAAAADPDLAVSIAQRKGETTQIDVSHAGPVAAFAERVGEADGLSVESLDAGSRTLVVELDPE